MKYDPKIITYTQLVEVFWRSVDPTDGGGQFCDRGESYSTAIFTTSPEQKQLAEASKVTIEKSGVLKRPIATKIAAAGTFYPAEEYHQNYHNKKPLRYKYYRWNCGRNQKVEKLWGDKAYMGIPKKGKSR